MSQAKEVLIDVVRYVPAHSVIANRDKVKAIFVNEFWGGFDPTQDMSDVFVIVTDDPSVYHKPKTVDEFIDQLADIDD